MTPEGGARDHHWLATVAFDRRRRARRWVPVHSRDAMGPAMSRIANPGDRPTSIAFPGGVPMPRFLIEVPHEAEKIACARAVRLLLQTGSHYLTHADFGCRDGDHRGWIIVEVDSKVEARNTLPPGSRAQARIVGLNKFSLEELDELLKQHGG
jgi:hypothetical protein